MLPLVPCPLRTLHVCKKFQVLVIHYSCCLPIVLLHSCLPQMICFSGCNDIFSLLMCSLCEARQAQLFPIRPALVVWAGAAVQARPAQQFSCGWCRAYTSLGKGQACSSSCCTVMLGLLSNKEGPGSPSPGWQAQLQVACFPKEGALRKGRESILKTSWFYIIWGTKKRKN